MRIIGGVAKGRNLRSPRGHETRPMTAKAREALFSSLGGLLIEANVLDLYAGSGSLGLEALSRGSASALFVERGRAALQALSQNIEAVGLGGQVVSGPVERFLGSTRNQFDLVFVDPPYATTLDAVEDILAKVAILVAPGGVLVLHRPSGESEPQVVEQMVLVDSRRYGGTALWRYQKEAS